MGVTTKISAKVDTEDIAVTNVKFKLAMKSNIYSAFIEKVYILLRI